MEWVRSDVTADLLSLLAAPIRDQWRALPAAEQISQLQRHRLLPIALAQVRGQRGGLDGLLAGLWDSLAAVGLRTAELDRRLLERVLPALAARGCRALLLKGAALGRWLYAGPELRPCSDIDVLIDARNRLAAHAALTDAGLRSDGYSHHDHASNQATYSDPDSNRQIDLHWALSVVPELACRFDFDALDADAIELAQPAGARALGRVDALMHAVIHYHAHRPVDDRPVIWLHDIALLARGLGDRGWAELDRKVRHAQLAGLHAAALQHAAGWFPLEAPAELMRQWQSLGQGECTRTLLGAPPSPTRRLLHSLSCITSMRGRIAYLRARLFPAADWMRGRYAANSSTQLARAYLRRWSAGLSQALNART
jgi:hypothetical protein